ncbi:MAG TPA: ABC transporter substrate-binding protein [Kiloniellales bacterium]|nr:ABC transporter substrate-binding protein [Kiloniellales bacterium]
MRAWSFALGAALLLSALATGTAADEMRTVRIGTEGAYPPFNSIDPSGKLIGFDIEIADALCAAAKFKCEFVIQDWDGIIPALQAGKFDAIIASMSITDKRKEVVDFTGKYYAAPAKFIAAEGVEFDFTQGSGLAGKKIGVQGSTIHEDYARAKWPQAEVVTYATQDEANADLASGRLDLVMANGVALLEGFLKTDAGQGFVFVGGDYQDPAFHGEGAGIAIRKGETELVNAFNAAIQQIRADGTYKAINDKYFDFDIYGD